MVGRVLTGRAKWIIATTKPSTGRGVPFSVVLWVTSSLGVFIETVFLDSSMTMET